jgi:hypothetical protein
MWDIVQKTTAFPSHPTHKILLNLRRAITDQLVMSLGMTGDIKAAVQ